MGVKQFFKPSKAKLFLFLTLLTGPFVLTRLASFFGYLFLLYDPVFSLLRFLPKEDIGKGLMGPTTISLIVVAVLGLVYFYFLSCLLVKAYERVKKAIKRSG